MNDENNPETLVGKILEASPEGFDPVDYVKSGGEEAAIEIYSSPQVRIIEPLTEYTLNDYIRLSLDAARFQEYTSGYGIMLVVIPADEGLDAALVFPDHPENGYDENGYNAPWKSLAASYGQELFQEVSNALAGYFRSKAESTKRGRGVWVKRLVNIGKVDQAIAFSRTLGSLNLSFSAYMEVRAALIKAGKKVPKWLENYMRSQRGVKFGKEGFWLLFNDWTDTVPFFDEDYRDTAERVFGGELDVYAGGTSNAVADLVDRLSPGNIEIVKQHLIGREIIDEETDSPVTITQEWIDENVSTESDLVNLLNDDNGDFDDITDRLNRAMSYAYERSVKDAYYKGYTESLENAFGTKEPEWVTVKNGDGKELSRLGFWFPYSRLDEWLKQWRENEYADENEFADIFDLASSHLEKARPSGNYENLADIDDDYYNECVAEELSDLDLITIQEPADPNQPELPMQGEPPRRKRELVRPATVNVGKESYKGVPAPEAENYKNAMNGKAGDRDIYIQAEAFLAASDAALMERAGDIKIEFEASSEAAESLVPLLKELRKMGSQGSSRNIRIEDWDGESNFDFDGDGASKIGQIKVAGKVVEALVESDDPKEFLSDNAVGGYALTSSGGISDGPELYMGPAGWVEDLAVAYVWRTREEAEQQAYHQRKFLPNYEINVHPIFQADIAEYDPILTPSTQAMGESQLLHEAVYKFSTTQVNVPKEIADHVIEWGKLNIPDEDLYIEEDGGCGREDEIHCTALYGLIEQAPSEKLKQIVTHTKPFMVELGGTSLFENEKFDVIKLDVISEELTNLHLELRRSCENSNKYTDYHPHVTVAYVKPGLGKKYAGNDVFKESQVPRDFWAYELMFKGAGDSESGERVVELIPFDKSKNFKPEEPEPGEARYPEALPESAQVDAKDFALSTPSHYVIKRWADPHNVDDVSYWAGEGMLFYRNINDAKLMSQAEAEASYRRMVHANYSPNELQVVGVMQSQQSGRTVYNESEDVDPKEFLAAYQVRIRCGRGAQTKYLYEGDSFVWTDIDRASVFDQDRANEIIENLFPGRKYAGREPVTTEAVEPGDTGDIPFSSVGESEDIDPKEFIAGIPTHVLQHWDEAGPEGGYRCSCGKWRYKLTGWSSSIPNAMKEFRAHKRQAAKAKPQQESEVDAKEFAMSMPIQYVVRSDHTPPKYLAQGPRAAKTYVYQTSDRTWAKIFSAAEAEGWAEYFNSPHRTNPRKPRHTWTAVPVDEAQTALPESEDPKDYVADTPAAHYMVVFKEGPLFWNAAGKGWTSDVKEATEYTLRRAEEILRNKRADYGVENTNLFDIYQVPYDPSANHDPNYVPESEGVDAKDMALSTPVYKAAYKVFPTGAGPHGAGPHGSGGWSRHARSRPQPKIVAVQTNDVKFEGRHVYINGVRRLKANVWDIDGKPVRLDYDDIPFDTQVNESASRINAKEFLDPKIAYTVRKGIGANTQYLRYDEPTGSVKWVDYSRATLLSPDKAYEIIQWIGPVYSGHPITTELRESEEPFSGAGLPMEPTEFLRKMRGNRRPKKSLNIL